MVASSEQMKAPVSHSNDPDLQKAPQALMRAAEKARQLVEQTGTPFVVRKGGHNIPEEVIRRRYAHRIANFERYKMLVDSWQLYDNSSTPAVLIEEGQNK